MKKIFSIIMSFLLVFSLVACGNNNPQKDTEPTSNADNLNLFNIEGYYYKTNKGTMILRKESDNIISPIIIENADEYDLSELSDGDIISITIESIRETYPSMTLMYGDKNNGYTLITKASPDFENDCSETIEQLNEMGYHSISDIPEEKPTIGLENPEEKMRELAEDNAELGLNILKEVLKDSDENILISPLSLYEDIALLTYAANGKTKEEIEENILDDSIENISSEICHFNNYVRPESVNIANSLWFNREITEELGINQEYANNAKALFSAEIQEIDYDENGVKQINDWVNKQTHEMIPEIVKELSPIEIVHLINALAFESEWETPYEETDIRETYTFTNADNKIDSVTMLFSYDEKVAEITDENDEIIANAFIRPYKDGKTAFVGILPEEGLNPEDIIASIDGDKFSDMCESFDYYDGSVTVGIPEFTLDYSLEMTDILKNIGMNTAFTSDADFSDMLTKDGTSIPVGGILQKTHIEVDRKGTKAAAATDIMLAGSAMPVNEPKIIILDRPFVYAIVDIESGMPYFIGIQQKIKD